MKCRIMGIIWCVCVLGAMGCGSAPDAPVPGGAPLSDEEILGVPSPGLENYVKIYEEVLEQNPTLDPESNDFARLVLLKVKDVTVQSTPKTGALSSGVAWVLGVTDAEWLLMARHPVNAARTWIAAQEAELRALVFDHGTGLADGRADAFRHAYWNVLMAKCCGLEWARDFATAHESESPPTRDDTKMDLNNNEAGRNIYSRAPGASDAEHIQMIKDFPGSCMRPGVTHDPSRLVYLQPCPVIRAQYAGEPSGAIDVLLDGTRLGTLSTTTFFMDFRMNDLRTGAHALTLSCISKGKHDACAVAVTLPLWVLTFADGSFLQAPSIAEGASVTLQVNVPPFGKEWGPEK
jgi:hypothetical protein